MIDGGAFVDDVTVEQASVAFPESHDEGSVSGFGQTLFAARCLGRKSVKKIDWISRQLVKKSILISSFLILFCFFLSDKLLSRKDIY